jgi:prepilin-type N-terminal cleavage/methylation domain-containing protein
MHRARAEQGVTLVELMVSLALAAMVMTAVVALWSQSQQAYMEGAEAADTQQRVRLAMDQLVKAIQQSGANPQNQAFGKPIVPPETEAQRNDPAYVAFREVGGSCLRLYSDTNGDGRVTGAAENLFFNWTGTNLTVENGGGADNGQIWVSPANPPQVIAVDIVANPGNTPMFQYFTGPNDAVSPNTLLPVTAVTPCANVMTDADRARIGRIVITLTAEGRVGNQVFRRTLRSDARPRNVP